MDFARHLELPEALDFHPVAWINVVFLLVAFFMASSYLTAPAPFDVGLPGAVTSDAANEDRITIILTGENIVYYNNRVVTIGELRQIFASAGQKRSLLIKVDRRASVGRIADIWSLARNLGVQRINVATGRDE